MRKNPIKYACELDKKSGFYCITAKNGLFKFYLTGHRVTGFNFTNSFDFLDLCDTVKIKDPDQMPILINHLIWKKAHAIAKQRREDRRKKANEVFQEQSCSYNGIQYRFTSNGKGFNTITAHDKFGKHNLCYGFFSGFYFSHVANPISYLEGNICPLRKEISLNEVVESMILKRGRQIHRENRRKKEKLGKPSVEDIGVMVAAVGFFALLITILFSLNSIVDKNMERLKQQRYEVRN